MIALEGVSVTYRNGHTALRDASLVVPGCSITALVGVNGSGKSTLFKAIMGFVPVRSGQVRVEDLPVARRSSATSSPTSPRAKTWTGRSHCPCGTWS